MYILRFDIRKIFGYYLFFAFWVSLHGVIDNLLHYAGIHFTTTTLAEPGLYREYGIMGEPFFLAIALTPAIVYHLCYFNTTWRKAKFRFLIIALCYLVTYSSIAVLGFVMGVFFSLYFNDFFSTRRGRAILLPVLVIPIVFATVFLVDNISLINVRFYDTTSLFLSKEIQVKEAGKSNSSTFALYSNYAIARDSFVESPLFGSGLGSHPLIYKETFLKYFPSDYMVMYGSQNQQDANSKFFRLMSETGLLGLILFFYAFIQFFAPKRKMTSPVLKEMGAINYSIFVYIMLCLIRNGNYINIGFFLFFFLYYLTWHKVIYNKPKFKSQVKHATMTQA
ncbi:MAG: O-antigen ligase family protein [Chitinophagaceae bacterium]|nr:O-antigen ligase family protein [Chitinophagaceae bacterium]